MSEPSALVYARHFNLTRDPADVDILHNLDLFDTCTQRPSTDFGIDEDCSQLLSVFETAAYEHLTLANDEPVQISRDFTTLLQQSTHKPDLNLQEIYQDLLPDPYHLRKHKLKIPLLVISGGDVHKDVRRIRKGINLNRVLDGILEDYEEAFSNRKRDGGHSSSTLSADILEMAQEELKKATREEIVEVPAKSLQYLKDARCRPVSKEDINMVLHDSLPPINRPIACTAKTIAQTEFELGSDDNQDQEPVEQPPTIPEEIETNPIILKQETNDLLSCLDIAVDNEIVRSDALFQPDQELNELLQQFTNHDFEGLEDGSTNVEDCNNCSMVIEPPHKRQKLYHEQHIDREPTALPSLRNHETPGQNKSYWHDRKIELPNVEPTQHQLPTMDLRSMINSMVNHGTRGVDGVNEQQRLPLNIPSMERVMQDALPDNDAILDRFLGKPKPVVTSDKLLFKEPGIRLLDKSDRDEEDLEVGDYPIDAWKTNTFLETRSGCDKEPRTEHDPHVKVEPDKRGQPSLHETTSSEATETHFTTVKTETRSPPWVRPSLLPQPGVRNPFDRSTMDIKKEVNQAGEQNGRTLGSTDTIRSAIHPTAKAESKPEPEESVAQLLNRLRKTDNRLQRPQQEDQDQGIFGSDSLSSFLDLRGKKFKPPPVQRIRKEHEIAEDPIQSTQTSAFEQDDCVEHNSSTTKVGESDLPEAKPALLPLVTALNQPKTLVLSNTLLQTKPLLTQFLERTSTENLSLIYRDLDQPEERGPDIILNATTCLLITNLQALNQRPLPGQKTATGLSNVHDRIAILSQKYPIVFILVHHIAVGDAGLQQKQTWVMTSFISFCHQLAATADEPMSKVSPVWVSCSDASSTSDAVNAWIWQLIQHHAYERQTPPNANPATNTDAALIQDETLWELLLVKAGLNPMAAQLVIGTLKRPGVPSGTPAGKDPNWGLRRLVCMKSAQRHDMFDKLVGKSVVARLNHVLQAR